MVFSEQEISNGGVNNYKYQMDSFTFTITHFIHTEIEYIRIKAFDSKWTDMYSMIADISALHDYKLVIPDIKTLYDVLQNPKINKLYKKKDHIVTYSVILEMGFNTIMIDFLLEKDILNQEQVKDIKIDELTKRVELLESKLTDTFENEQTKLRINDFPLIINFITLIITHLLHKVEPIVIVGSKMNDIMCINDIGPLINNQFTILMDYNIKENYSEINNLVQLQTKDDHSLNYINTIFQKYKSCKVSDIMNDIVTVYQKEMLQDLFSSTSYIGIISSSYLRHYNKVKNINIHYGKKIDSLEFLIIWIRINDGVIINSGGMGYGPSKSHKYSYIQSTHIGTFNPECATVKYHTPHVSMTRLNGNDTPLLNKHRYVITNIYNKSTPQYMKSDIKCEVTFEYYTDKSCPE